MALTASGRWQRALSSDNKNIVQLKTHPKTNMGIMFTLFFLTAIQIQS
jgi:hypothetical protein